MLIHGDQRRWTSSQQDLSRASISNFFLNLTENSMFCGSQILISRGAHLCTFSWMIFFWASNAVFADFDMIQNSFFSEFDFWRSWSLDCVEYGFSQSIHAQLVLLIIIVARCHESINFHFFGVWYIEKIQNVSITIACYQSTIVGLCCEWSFQEHQLFLYFGIGLLRIWIYPAIGYYFVGIIIRDYSVFAIFESIESEFFRIVICWDCSEWLPAAFDFFILVRGAFLYICEHLSQISLDLMFLIICRFWKDRLFLLQQRGMSQFSPFDGQFIAQWIFNFRSNHSFL